MAPDIKFCGLTRAEDAEAAAALGARYAGVIFAGGPRNLTGERAAEVLATVGDDVRRVGVFARADVRSIAQMVRTASLDVVQLHGDPSVADIEAVRDETACLVWPVLRIGGSTLPHEAADLIGAGDAMVLDAKVEGSLGGTGVTLPWLDIADSLRHVRGDRDIVLAGGLNASNVREAIAALHPDVVDVSSGVERAPGVKDHARMREFSEAVWR